MTISGLGSNYGLERARVSPEERHARIQARINMLTIDLAAAKARGDVKEAERIAAQIATLN
ncbi:hypothetical protein pEaSNUABM11_00082 [Erwinia phage pEa_SNUABM_11]|nr:hypothetical protein pEaSNUABM11_00082 [Erwinia phage pEa_SNUABM_11]